jgi:hypothetical protein
MHQSSNIKRTYNTSVKNVVVVGETKRLEMGTFSITTVDMPGRCIFKTGPERVKFRVM